MMPTTDWSSFWPGIQTLAAQYGWWIIIALAVGMAMLLAGHHRKH